MHLRVLRGGLAAQGQAMKLSEQHELDRIWAAVDALNNTARSLERLHEMDASQAIEYFDKTLASADESPSGGTTSYKS